MSVNVTTTQQPSTWFQRLTGTEPKTVIRETSTTEVTSVPGGSFDLKTALRNGGIGAAVAGALGGVSLLGKIALPLIGKVASVGGLVKLAGVGGALGVATAALPWLAPKIRDNPTAKAAVTGAAIGGAAGLVLPFVPAWLGAAVGAGVGLLVHNRRNQPAPDYPVYPGYQAYPGYAPYGTSPGAPVPSGLVPVTPNYGSYAAPGYGYPAPVATAGYPVGATAGYGYGYPAATAGYGTTLPMQGVVGQPAVTAAPGVAAPAPAPAAAKPAKAPKFQGAKTFTDGAGNIRQVGTGKIVKASPQAAARAAAAAAMPTAAQAAGYPTAGYPTTAGVGLAQLTSPASYLPGMASSLPYSGASPLTAGATSLAGMTAAAGSVPTLGGVQPGSIPARPTAAS